MRRLMLIVAIVSLAAVAGPSPLPSSEYCSGALLAQAAGQDSVMPPEGNPEHVKPAEGAFCDHSKRPAHECACHAMCVEDSDGNVVVQEDGVHCRANCFKKHCHCPADNCQAPH